MDLEQLNRSAYHEAGHVVFTYYFGYSCQRVQVLPTGDAKTEMNYGADLLPITAISNFITENFVFSGLEKDAKIRCVSIAHPATIILFGGSAAESIYRNVMADEGHMEVEVSGPDLDRVNQIDRFLASCDPEHPPTFLQTAMTHTLKIAKDKPEFWSAIDNIAKGIIAAPNYTLYRAGLEKILTECGFFTFCETEVE
jgi:hypothetical protein